MKKAFTLIELLVVIAIIAILAAILFPVFAQAKAAAKKTSSLSNCKQLALGVIMYGGDSDDIVPVAASWNQSDALVFFGAPNGGYKPWSHLVYPYTKNGDIYVDPQVGAGTKAPAGFQPLASTILAPNYGINPYLIQQATYPYATSSPLSPRSFTAVSRPADTVMLTQKYSSKEQGADANSAANAWYGYWFFGNLTYFITVTADPPDCWASGNVQYCVGGWGNSGYYGSELKGVEAAGAWTGGGSMRGTKQMLVTFTDGHAGSKAPGLLAEGTNYNGVKGSNGVPTQSESAIAITDITKEHYYGVR